MAAKKTAKKSAGKKTSDFEVEVVVYTSPTCPWCTRVKDFLAEHDISFEEKDVSNAENAEDAVAKSGQMGVPVIDIDGTIIVGFDEEALREKLHLD